MLRVGTLKVIYRDLKMDSPNNSYFLSGINKLE